MSYSLRTGLANFIVLYRLSRNLIDFNMPYVIHLDFLCLYLLNLTNFPVMCFFLAVSITSSMTLYLALGFAVLLVSSVL